MTFNKAEIIAEVLRRLERELETLHQSALENKAAATHEEAKAENKYDTRGLEAGYVAAGQAKRVAELGETINLFSRSQVPEYDHESVIGVFGLVSADVEDLGVKHFLLVPRQGGEKIEVEGQSILTLSLESPLGKRLLRKKVGDVFEFVSQGQNREYEITAAQ